MLSKKYRLPAYLIPEVLKKGRRFYSSFFTLIVDRRLQPEVDLGQRPIGLWLKPLAEKSANTKKREKSDNTMTPPRSQRDTSGVEWEGGVSVTPRGWKRGNQSSRFCIIVPKKIDKRANKRNRIKRQLSEALGLNLKKITPGFNIIILAKKEIFGKDFSLIRVELEKALKSSKVQPFSPEGLNLVRDLVRE